MQQSDFRPFSVKPRALLRWLAGPQLAALTLAWLMVLLILGTLAQAEMGLYQAQQRYFSSLLLWLGPVPTPGGVAAMVLLGLGLSLKLILYPWKRNQFGSLLAHLAVWLLLVGGALTALTSHQGYLKVAEGETTAIINSYHTSELAVQSPSDTTLATVPFAALTPGSHHRLGSQSLRIEQAMANSLLTQRPEPLEDGRTQGALRFFDFTPKALERDDERNRPTIIFVREVANASPARLVLFQGQPVPQPWPLPGEPSATLVLRPAQTTLPFAVTLQRFEAAYHPGTAVARHYASAVTITSPASGQWPAFIAMNAPLRYQGYTLYQSSFLSPESQTEGATPAQTSILAVVKNQGYLIPYVAGILLCLGLLLHLALRLWPRRRGGTKSLLMVALLAWLMPLASHAAPSPMLAIPAAFSTLPIQHEGRIKPLGTFARLTLHGVSGAQSLPGLTASAWLAEAVFAPTVARTRPIFALPNATLRTRLGLPAAPHNRYSYLQVAQALRPHFQALTTIVAQPLAQRDPLDAQLLALATAVQQVFVLTETAAPSAPAVAENLPPLLAVLPPRLGEETWQAPHQTNLTTPYAATWAAMAVAYQQGDAALFEAAVAAAQRQATTLPGVRPTALLAEEWLHRLRPFEVITGLLVLALGLVAWRRTEPLVLPILAVASVLGIVAIVARSYVLQRPPVGTLYESVIFVAVLLMVLVALLAWRNPATRRQWLGLGATGALGLNLLGLRYAASGDTLGVLTAVLETNFWLTTHVLVITAGYALATLAGLWAHAVGAQMLRHQNAPIAKAMATLQILLLAALAFTATGTLLGGIWADQSWGRIWGWDPKENGALLLTLWLIWLLHARLAKLCGPVGLVAGAALTPSVVMLSWFGVNLLGVGLHSYGFTQGTGLWLGVFITAQLAMVAGALWAWRRRR